MNQNSCEEIVFIHISTRGIKCSINFISPRNTNIFLSNYITKNMFADHVNSYA